VLTFELHHLVPGLPHINIVVMTAGYELAVARRLVMQDLGPVVGLVVVRLNCLPYARQVFPKTAAIHVIFRLKIRYIYFRIENPRKMENLLMLKMANLLLTKKSLMIKKMNY
jgi:hypothetical protein